MTRRYLVGGESNSSKSTFVLSLVAFFESRGYSAEAVELDVWSNSYPAFRGEIDFDKRPKRFDLKWNWKRALNKRLQAFNTSRKQLVFGDMPGVLGAAGTHMCNVAKPTGAIVISRSIEGLKAWQRFFRDDFDIPIVALFLSVQKIRPAILPDMNRNIDGSHDSVTEFGRMLIKSCRPQRRAAPKRKPRAKKRK